MRRLALLVAIAFLAVSDVRAGLITVTDVQLTSRVTNPDVPIDDQDLQSRSELIIGDSVTASKTDGIAPPNNNSSTTTLNYASALEQESLTFGYEHSRLGTPGSMAQSLGSVTIAPTTHDVAFALSGYYRMLGDNEIRYTVSIQHVGTKAIPKVPEEELPPGKVPKKEPNEPLDFFGTAHAFHSDDTLNEWFVLGTPGGDNPSKKVPASKFPPVLTGILHTGEIYSLSFNAYISSFDYMESLEDVGLEYPGDAGATAEGAFTMSFEAVTSTPEPASCALLGLATLGGIGLRLRNRRAAGKR